MSLVWNPSTSIGGSPPMPVYDSARQDYLGETPLHKAARAGSVPCGRVLAADGRALPHLVNTSGQTPARLAAACGHAQMAAWLTEHHTSAALQATGQWAGLGGTINWHRGVIRDVGHWSLPEQMNELEPIYLFTYLFTYLPTHLAYLLEPICSLFPI